MAVKSLPRDPADPFVYIPSVLLCAVALACVEFCRALSGLCWFGGLPGNLAAFLVTSTFLQGHMPPRHCFFPSESSTKVPPDPEPEGL